MELNELRELSKETIGIQMAFFIPSFILYVCLRFKYLQKFFGLENQPNFQNFLFYLSVFSFAFIIYNLIKTKPKFKELKENFYSDKMYSDMLIVNKWWKTHKLNDFDNIGDDIDKARHSISERYNAIYDYYKNSKHKREIKRIIDIDRIDFFFKKIDPLEKHIETLGNGNYIPDMSLFFKDLFKKELKKIKKIT
jgi:hypothetical protein